MRGRYAGDQLIKVPIGGNYAQRHFFLGLLDKEQFFKSDTIKYVFHDQLIFTIEDVKWGDNKSDYAKCQKIVELFDKAVYQSTGQITIIKYSYQEDAKAALTAIGSPKLQITDGVNKIKRSVVYYQTEDVIKPWTVSISISEEEDPETTAKWIREEVVKMAQIRKGKVER